MKEKTRYFYGTIHAERATNEWQRENALPERYATAPPAEQARMREYYAVSDDECEEMRKIYATFPQHLVFMRSGVHQDEYVLVGWKKEQDEGVREAIWLLEQLGGAYEGYREKFLEDWAKEQYDPWGCWTIPDCLMEVEGEMVRTKAPADQPDVPPDEPLPFDLEETEGKNYAAKSDRS